jgi:anthranilate phosphoribosyltransferase
VLVAAAHVTTLLDGVAVAAHSIDSGAARRALEDLVRVSHEVAA